MNSKIYPNSLLNIIPYEIIDAVGKHIINVQPFITNYVLQ